MPDALPHDQRGASTPSTRYRTDWRIVWYPRPWFTGIGPGPAKDDFSGVDLYPNLSEKAAALAFSVIKNHPFIDGNKRIAHALLEAFLLLNDFELRAEVDEQETLILELASGLGTRDALVDWIREHVTQEKTSYEAEEELQRDRQSLRLAS